MEAVMKMDRQEVQKTNGADFGTSELIRYYKNHQWFSFPFAVEYLQSTGGL